MKTLILAIITLVILAIPIFYIPPVFPEAFREKLDPEMAKAKAKIFPNIAIKPGAIPGSVQMTQPCRLIQREIQFIVEYMDDSYEVYPGQLKDLPPNLGLLAVITPELPEQIQIFKLIYELRRQEVLRIWKRQEIIKSKQQNTKEFQVRIINTYYQAKD